MAIQGLYAYRFSGFAVVQEKSFHVIGVGTMTASSDGRIRGQQSSTATKMVGAHAVLSFATYSMEGTWWATRGDGANEYQASITFDQTGGNEHAPTNQHVEGNFRIVAAGGVADPGEHLWLISAGATTDGKESDEVISGEAVRIAATP